MSRRYWLMKSEPDEFSIENLARVGVEPWSGVRNYQARNYMRDGMRIGDGVLFYHSNCDEPGVVGLAEVASGAYPDPTQFDASSDYHDPASTREAPRWLLVDVRFKRRLRRTITLAELKASAELEDFALVQRGNRLSVLPVTKAQWDFILALEKRSAA
ncbi:MAG TPA: EVE domain-containing protein [Dokdonella sp.]|uniref:EVE domain-containing protein n=1 Tax=Dokdonella sp. TaxID=2291710 RepID=UPI0025BFB3C5|nr:EVE domain-containing protein [Dokdonella sp.]MBX3691527.1 EVE domain-containing protein [Dokdonella sp.]MCW5568042.1 EVE domain-containing protein [Dokdonella sp.]HNR91503.1 EVE domain-containing protein [Dokdonella sp.]